MELWFGVLHMMFTFNHNPRQNLLSQTNIFSIFRQKSQRLLIQLKYSVNPPSPQVNVVCLDSGDVLHDFFRVTEINDIVLGGKGGHLLFRSTFFPFCDKGFGEDCLRSSEWMYACLGM